MRDTGKILAGLAVFIVLFTGPIWYNLARGQAGKPPELVTGTEAKRCIESTEFMRASHMNLLNAWREDVIRRGQRDYMAGDGKHYDKSLTRTCLMQCHQDKAKFCDRCHTYEAVTPYCWDCHVAPPEKP